MINENECLGGKIVKKNEEMERKKKGVATMSGEEWARRDNHIFRVWKGQKMKWMVKMKP